MALEELRPTYDAPYGGSGNDVAGPLSRSDPRGGVPTLTEGSATGGSTLGSSQGWDTFLKVMSVVVPALTAVVNAKNVNEAEEAKRNAIAAAQRIMSPEEFNRIVNTLLPAMRAGMAGGAGQQLRQSIDTAVARHGGTGTGVGEAFKAIGSSLPEIEAFRNAVSSASGIQALGVQGNLNAAGLYEPKADPYTLALTKGLQGLFEYD